jgi:hypothetical protein
MMMVVVSWPQWVVPVGHAYRQLAPSAWIDVYRLMPPALGVSFAAIGALLLFFGGDRAFRVLSPFLGVAIGALWANAFLERVGLSFNHAGIVASIVLATAGLLAPATVVFVGLALPSALLGGALVGQSDWILGAVPAFVFGGVFGLIFFRQLCVTLAALVGSWLLMLGLFSALAPVTSLVSALSSNAPVVLSLAGCLAACGVVFQLFIRKSPELRAQLQVERANKKTREKEERALERRWADAPWRKKKRG